MYQCVVPSHAGSCGRAAAPTRKGINQSLHKNGEAGSILTRTVHSGSRELSLVTSTRSATKTDSTSCSPRGTQTLAGVGSSDSHSTQTNSVASPASLQDLPHSSSAKVRSPKGTPQTLQASTAPPQVGIGTLLPSLQSGEPQAQSCTPMPAYQLPHNNSIPVHSTEAKVVSQTKAMPMMNSSVKANPAPIRIQAVWNTIPGTHLGISLHTAPRSQSILGSTRLMTYSRRSVQPR